MKKKITSKRERVLKNSRRFEFRIVWLIPVVVIAAGIAFAVWPRNSDGSLRFGAGGASKQTLRAAEGEFLISIPDVSDGKAHYFSHKFTEGTVNFFVLQSSDSVIRAAFDACDVCFRSRKGYRQEGDLMICNNCGQSFPSVRINVEQGGCNPAPLNRTTRGDDLVITIADLYKGIRYF